MKIVVRSTVFFLIELLNYQIGYGRCWAYFEEGRRGD